MTREYIGIDLHKSFFQACVVSATGERLWEGRFHRTADGLAQFVARGVGADQAVAVEASGPTSLRGCVGADGRAGLCD